MAKENQTISTLHNLLDYDASRFTSAEVLLQNSLPQWIQNAGSLQLKTVLQKYLDFIQQHVANLERFFEEEKVMSLSRTNRVMEAFVAETDEKLSDCADAEVRDACLLACVQSINHFKISMYGTAATFANSLGMGKDAVIFHDAEVNEKEIDERLSQLANQEINNRAKAPIALTA